MQSIPSKLTETICKPLDNQVKKSDEPLPKGNRCWIIIGSKGSGKSTILLNALKHKEAYRKWFDNIYLISPTASRDDKFDTLVNELKKEGKYYTKCDDDNVLEIMEKIKDFNDDFDEEEVSKKKKKRAPGPPRNLIVFDDCLHDLPKSSEKSIINHLMTQMRHFKTSVWITSQKFKTISTLIRNQADLCSFFKPSNKVERNGILDEWNIPPEVLDFATKKPNGFLHVSFCGSKSPLFFVKFDPIKFIEEEKD